MEKHFSEQLYAHQSRVYHKRCPNVNDPTWPDDYELVALTPPDGLDAIYRQTQHSSTRWDRSGDVVVVNSSFGRPARSTTLGDVVAIAPKKTAWRYDASGWAFVGYVPRDMWWF